MLSLHRRCNVFWRSAPYPQRRLDACEDMVSRQHIYHIVWGVWGVCLLLAFLYLRRTKRPSRLLTARGVPQTRARALSQLSREHAGRPPRPARSSSSAVFLPTHHPILQPSSTPIFLSAYLSALSIYPYPISPISPISIISMCGCSVGYTRSAWVS